MARPKASPEQREKVRQSIQQAAVEIYRAEGIGGISARAVAKKAGVSVGTIYSYFGDLNGLGQSLWEPQIAQVDAEFRELATHFDEPLARIEALICAYLDFGISQAALYRNALMFVRPTAQETPEKRSVSDFAFPVLIQAAIEEGQGAGTIARGDPSVMAQVLWSGVHGALALPVNMDRLDLAATKDVSHETVTALMRSIRPD